MLKKFLILVMASVFLSGCSLGTKKSGLEIMSFPVANVYINGKDMGTTPYKNMNLKPGENEVRLVADNKQWKRKVDLQNNINTIIDWQFGETTDEDSGYVLYLEKTGSKKASLMVNTTPDKTTVSVDGQTKGISPMKVADINQGDRQLSISLLGYKDVNVFMKAIDGYQLVVNAKLALEKTNIDQIINNENQPTPSSLSTTGQSKIVIKETETGWLRVRDLNSNLGKEVTKVKPGESYNLIDEQNGWYKIDLGNGKSGWISATYGEKN
jgi:hypothetical protein